MIFHVRIGAMMVNASAILGLELQRCSGALQQKVSPKSSTIATEYRSISVSYMN
jgi:hypothetical protein